MIAKDTIFREYDIRGVVDRDFDADFARVLGRALAIRIKAACAGQPRVAVGRDCRLSGQKLSSALIEGLLEYGIDVIDSGMGPTPQLYYVVFSQKLDGGVQVTGSHNPADQNGFKMMIGLRTLSGGDITALRDLVFGEAANGAAGCQRGKLEEFNANSAYTQELIARSLPQMGLRKLKVVVDGGNGVGGMVGPSLLRALGCEVSELYTDPDGRFPNHHPDPTVLENIIELRTRVKAESADLGIAWDGDADRIGVVDEQGDVIYGDMLLYIYARQLLKEVKNPTIIADVKCSELLFTKLKEEGVHPVMCKTGHSLIKAKLKELGAQLAGEMSGHMFFVHRYFGFDDALHASARLIEIMSHEQRPLSKLLGDLPKMVSTPEIRMDCAEEHKFQVVERAKRAFPEYQATTVDGVRVAFPHGWGLVRASNTQPILVLRFEAESEAQLNEYQQLMESRIEEIKQKIIRP